MPTPGALIGLDAGEILRMFYRVVADITVAVHLLWILFLLFGAVLGVRYRSVRIVHFAGLGFALVLNVFGWYCPLTYLEVWARSRHDPTVGYAGSFIIHYAEELIYVSLPRWSLVVMTVVLAGANAWYYTTRLKRQG